MKVMHKKGYLGYSGNFNTSSLSEIVVYFEEGDCSSEFIKEYDVFIKAKNEWKDLGEAFKDRDIIVDNYNTRFFEPDNEEDRQRGYTLF